MSDQVYIDVHTHANLAAYRDDHTEVMRRALEAGVWMVNVGTQYDTSKRAVELIDEFQEGVYATVGLHPVHTSPSYHDEDEIGEEGKAFTSRGEVFDSEAYKKLAQHPKVVAIGECGLDYYRVLDPEAHKKQIEVFEMHIALANEIKKPLMLHLRSGKGGNAYKDAQRILKAQAKVLGNSHFFAGSLEDAKVFWNMGYSTSFTGVITFARDYDEVVREAPAELLHTETDAPYVTPVPHRGERNEPVYVIEVVKKMAEIRGTTLEVQRAQLIENARIMFIGDE
jgi:TatD DNase family protein